MTYRKLQKRMMAGIWVIFALSLLLMVGFATSKLQIMYGDALSKCLDNHGKIVPVDRTNICQLPNGKTFPLY